MALPELISELDAQIARLTEARKLLAGSGIETDTRGRGRTGRRHMSAEARRRISAAQKRRWALRKDAQSSGSQTSSANTSAKPGRRRMSAAGRARIVAAQKARWAAVRARQAQPKKKK